MKPRILVLEETPGAARSCVEALDRERRYEVCLAPAGPQAVCRAHEFGPDLLIAQLPLDGGETLKAVQTLGWVDRLPSLVLTERRGLEPLLEGLPSRTRCLPPSCDGSDLLSSVRDLISAPDPSRP